MAIAKINLTETRKYLSHVVVDAGKIAMRYFKSSDLEQKDKGFLDIVTTADLEVDKLISSKLKSKFPSIPILSEETFTGDYEKGREEEWLWIVDPIDGTINFSRGNDQFAVSIALVSFGKTQIAVCYKPCQQELYWAQADKDNSYMNGVKLKVDQTNKLSYSIIAVESGYLIDSRISVGQRIKLLYKKSCFVKILMSSVSGMLQVATAEANAYFDVDHKPWDVAAAALIVEKAGAKITSIKGQKFDVFTPTILAANSRLYTKLLRIIN